MQDKDVILDTALLARVCRRWMSVWKIIGPLLFVVLLLIFLLAVPQKYTATSSVSVQQSANTSSPLSVLTGSSSSKKYIGILQSRKLAAEVESKVNLKSFYHLKTNRDAELKLQQSLGVNDSPADSLLHVSVTLSAPPRFWFWANAKRQQTSQLAAKAANAYVQQLKLYYSSSDNDVDSVLLRTGRQVVAKADAKYHAATSALIAFVQGLNDVSPAAAPSTANNGGVAAVTLSQLYSQEAAAETALAALNKTRTLQEEGLFRQLRNVNSLPAEDPLLRSARADLLNAQARYDDLTQVQQLASGNPEVVQARAALQLAARQLDNQKQGYYSNLTTAYIDTQTKIAQQRATLKSVLDLIRTASRQLAKQRGLSTEMALLQQNQKASLSALEAAQSEYVHLRLTSVSGQSRFLTVDTALSPRRSAPSLLLSLALSLLLTLLPLAALIAGSYFWQSWTSTSETA